MNHWEPTQIDKLGEIGRLLQAQRQQKGLSLEDVATQTLIRASILQALEAGQVNTLPEPVYLRGFIRRYADLVGLRGEELAKALPLQPPVLFPLKPDILKSEKFEEQEAKREAAAAAAAKVAVVAQREPAAEVTILPGEPSATQPNSLPWLGFGAALLALLGAIAFAASQLSKPVGKPVGSAPEQPVTAKTTPAKTAGAQSQPTRSPTARPSPVSPAPQPTATLQPTPDNVTASPSPITSPTPNPKPSPTASPTGNKTPLNLKFEARDEAWIAVYADGTLVFEGVLPKGSQKTWTAQETLDFSTGRSDVVWLGLNGAPLKQFGNEPNPKGEIFTSGRSPATISP